MDNLSTTEEHSDPVIAAWTGSGLTPEELTQLSAKDLYTLFQNGQTPEISDIEGPYVGVQLASAGFDLPGFRQLNRWFADSIFFPWQGKSFRFLGEGQGEGTNQIRGGRRLQFRFKTYLAPSRLGDYSTFHLDYGQPSNPVGVRLIRDELREVAPGIYLGLIFIKWGSKSIPVAFFSLSKGSPEGPSPAVRKRHRRQKMVTAAAAGTLLTGLVLWLKYGPTCQQCQNKHKKPH